MPKKFEGNPCAFFSVFFFLAITGTLTSGYHFADDHEIIKINNDLESKSFSKVIYNWIDTDFNIRFRPLYFIHRIIETRIFGTNLLFWSLYNGLLAFLTFSFFYLGLKKLRFSTLEAIIFLIVAFIGPQTSIWWRLGPNQTIGLVFLSLSFYFMTTCLVTKKYNLNNYLFCFFLVLSSLCKESFIIIIPAFVIYKICNEKNNFNIFLKEAIKKNLVSILPLIIMIIEIFIILFFIETNKLDNTSFNSNLKEKIQGILLIAKNLKLYFFIIILITGTIYLKLKNKAPTNFIASLKPAFIFFILIVVPNIFLYLKTDMEEGRYLIPTTIGIAFFIINLIKNLGNYTTTTTLKSLLLIITFIFSLNPITYKDILDNSFLFGLYDKKSPNE